MAIFDPYMVAIFIGCLQPTLCQLDIIGNLMFEANFEVFLLFMGGGYSQNFESQSLVAPENFLLYTCNN